MAMVVRANQHHHGIGGHISTFASCGDAVRSRLQPLLPRRTGRHRGGDQVYFQGHASPGVYARAFLEGRLTDAAAACTSAASCSGGGLVVLSASVADARLLAVPHRVDGARPDHVDLPGALQPLPARPRPARHRARSHVWAFLGDGETDEPETLGAITLAVARAARQPDLGHQLQPAAPRRPGARQRQDHSGAGSRLPRRRLERHQGHLGRRLGSAAGARRRTACSCSAWARSSTASIRSTPCRPAATSASTSSAPIRELLELVEDLTDDQAAQACAAAATTRRRSMRRTRRRSSTTARRR